MTQISLIYITNRPGSIDMLRSSLEQDVDYELIIVDDYKIDRVDKIKNYLKDTNVDIRYIGKSKEKCFPDTSQGQTNAWNTGIMKSTGKFLVFMQDYTLLPKNSLRKWLKYVNDKKAVSGVARYFNDCKFKRKDTDNEMSLWDKHWVGTPEDNGINNYHIWKADKFEMFYFGVGYKLLEDINGFSECYDNSPDPVTPFMEIISKTKKYEYIVDESISCDMLNHRVWGDIFSSIGHTQPSKLIKRDNCFNIKDFRKNIDNNIVSNEDENSRIKNIFRWT